MQEKEGGERTDMEGGRAGWKQGREGAREEERKRKGGREKRE